MNKHLLIVEQKDDLRLLLSSYLSNQHAVWSAKSGFHALNVMKRANVPDLVVLSSFLPDINTMDFLTSLRTSGLFGDVPIVILGVYEDPPSHEKSFLDLGANAYFKQPFDPDKLLDTVNKLL